MSQELMALTITAASIGFLHTLLGPDHYLPFVVMARAGRWSPIKTAWVTVLCGMGHVGSSVLLGMIGIALGLAVTKLEATESLRGNLAAWALIAFSSGCGHILLWDGDPIPWLIKWRIEVRSRPKPKVRVRPEKKLVRFLLARLEDAYEKSKWHSFKGALEGLAEAEAAWRPPNYKSPEPWGFSGSILEILVHVAGDSLAMINQFFGDESVTYETVRERFQTQGSDLKAALALLEGGYTTTRKALAKLTDNDLKKKVGKKKTWRADRVFLELIEHYLYHAGQINYICCLWDGTKPKEEP